MRNLIIPIVLLIISCTNYETVGNEEEFVARAKRLHSLYVTAGDCDEMNSMIDENIIFYENGRPFTYKEIAEYCSYAQPKNVYETFSKQNLVRDNVGFDFVDHHYTNSDSDTLREITSRIWEFKSNRWVITHIEVSRMHAAK